MKTPNLYFNHYYPFYTFESFGVKKHSHIEVIVMHLSLQRGIKATIRYEQMKVKNIELKFINDASYLYNHNKDNQDITYRAFATHIKTIFTSIAKALKMLQSEPCYLETMIFSNLLKFNSEVEFKASYSNIEISFNNPDYSIMDGKKVRKEKKDYSEHKMLNKLNEVIIVIDNHTKYKEIEQSQFKSDLDECLERFIPYLEAPKFIRKKQYEL